VVSNKDDPFYEDEVPTVRISVGAIGVILFIMMCSMCQSTCALEEIARNTRKVGSRK
jgi:hypothetical protein